MTTSDTNGPAELRRLAGEYDLTCAACWDKTKTADMWRLAAAWGAERAQAAADLAALKRLTDASRRFPLLDGPSVPWSRIAPHERQAQANHGQTIQRLAERGGLSCAEFWFVMNDKKWDDAQMSNADKSGRALAEMIIASNDKMRLERDEARAALAQARALLKKIGIFRYDGMDCCVMCDTPIIDGHAPGCELAAALSGGAR